MKYDKTCHKRTAQEFMDVLTPKSLCKKAINRLMNPMRQTEKREVRRIVRERFKFYSKLRRLVGEYRETDKDRAVRMKRMEKLPFSINQEDATCWKFVDATRGINLPGSKLIIPSIQRQPSGKVFLDIRTWKYVEDDKGTTVKPTKKGICLPIEHLPELRGLLEALTVRWERELKRRANIEKQEKEH